MPPPERLRSSREIRSVVAARNVRRGLAVSVHVRARGDTAAPRAAVVAGRKVGGAVERNRAKRRLRAALAELDVASGTDLVAVAGPEAGRVPFTALREELETLVRQQQRTRGGRR